MSRALPAAVYLEADPRSVGIANTIPGRAELVKSGNAILGYHKTPLPAERTSKQLTRLEMQGYAHRKALRMVVLDRRARGVDLVDLTAWATIAADLAAAIKGPRMSLKSVEGTCAYLQIDIDSATLAPLAARAAQWRRSPDYAPLTGAEIGRMIDLKWPEREALGITKIGASDETPEERRTRLERRRSALRRQQAGACPHGKLKNWEILGISRSSYYARNLHLDENDRCSVISREAVERVQISGKAVETVQLSGRNSIPANHPIEKRSKPSRPENVL